MSQPSLVRLFRLIEITRLQPQYGYFLSEVSKADISDLAQHHYLVTFVAWTLSRLAIANGAQINLTRVLEFTLIHDLGELFGGDIGMPYAKANPAARTAAKEFERQNQIYLSTFFPDQEYIDALSEEILDAKSDEALIAKLADYIEVTHYKLFIKQLSEGDIVMADTKLTEMIDKITDQKAKQALSSIITQWIADMRSFDHKDLFEDAKYQ